MVIIPHIVPHRCDIVLFHICRNTTWVTHPSFSLLFDTICGIKARTHDYAVQLIYPTNGILSNRLRDHGFLLECTRCMVFDVGLMYWLLIGWSLSSRQHASSYVRRPYQGHGVGMLVAPLSEAPAGGDLWYENSLSPPVWGFGRSGYKQVTWDVPWSIMGLEYTMGGHAREWVKTLHYYSSTNINMRDHLDK